MGINNVVLMGRICQDLELKQTPNGKHVLSFSLAVDSNYKQQDGTYKTNFINCVAWEQKADFISRYFRKGAMIALTGELTQRTYQGQDGRNHYIYEVNVLQTSFTGEKKEDSGGNYQQPNYQNSGNYQQQSRPNVNVNVEPQQPQPQINIDDFEEVISDSDLPF